MSLPAKTGATALSSSAAMEPASGFKARRCRVEVVRVRETRVFFIRSK